MGRMRTTADAIGSNLSSGVAGSVNEALFNVTVRQNPVLWRYHADDMKDL